MSGWLFMFPGQGSQSAGMCREVYDQEAMIRDLFARGSEFCQMDLTKMCFESDEAELKKTENAQPAIFLCSYALYSLLRSKTKEASWMAGHSLGEYAAVAASGMLSFKDAIKLVRTRGLLMARAGNARPGTMAAILGLADTEVEAVCAEASRLGVAVLANYNSPGQAVISGEVAGVQKAMELAKARGAKRAIQLQVSGAFHSPLMQEIAGEFSEVLQSIRFLDTKTPVISNVTGRSVTSGEEIKGLLLRQLTSPVRWTECMKTAKAEGADLAVEIGPGNVLCGLSKRISPELKTISVEGLAGITEVLAQSGAASSVS